MRTLIKVGTNDYGGILENNVVIYYWHHEDKGQWPSDFEDFFKLIGIEIVNSDSKEHLKVFVNHLIDENKFL